MEIEAESEIAETKPAFLTRYHNGDYVINIHTEQYNALVRRLEPLIENPVATVHLEHYYLDSCRIESQFTIRGQPKRTDLTVYFDPENYYRNSDDLFCEYAEVILRIIEQYESSGRVSVPDACRAYLPSRVVHSEFRTEGVTRTF